MPYALGSSLGSTPVESQFLESADPIPMLSLLMVG